MKYRDTKVMCDGPVLTYKGPASRQLCCFLQSSTGRPANTIALTAVEIMQYEEYAFM